MTDEPTLDPVSSIQQALSIAKERIGPIEKGDRNKDLNYQFRGIDSILNKAGPVLTDLGIVTSPKTLLVSSEAVESSQGTRGYRVIVETEWTFSVYLPEIGEVDTLVARTLGEAIDYSDKAVNKAQRQSEKNAWQQVLSIPTGEPDPDSENPTQHSPTARAKTTAELVLDALVFEGMKKTEAKEYARRAREETGIDHPIPEDRIEELVREALRIHADLNAPFQDDEPDDDPSVGY